MYPRGFDFCCLYEWSCGLVAWLTGYSRIDEDRLYWLKDEEDEHDGRIA